MSTDDNCIGISNTSNTCANCGKEGSTINNTCNKCKSVMYCNAACKKKHRHKHKKDCEEHVRLAADRAAKQHDENLFKQPPLEYEDCPICFLRIPSLTSGSIYMTCCGKIICSGCFYANAKIDVNKQLCAFCRIPAPKSEEEAVQRLKKRTEAGDAMAIFNIGSYYYDGDNGYKALELWHKAGELGISGAYNNIGSAYERGRNVEIDEKKAKHYFELAAMRGHVTARHKLGCMEQRAGNMNRAIKHFMIAAKSGDTDSLKKIQQFYSNDATKDDYTSTLQAYQEYLSEIKSVQRDEAAAFSDKYKYY